MLILSQLDILGLFAGLGLFLLGMDRLETGISRLSQAALRRAIKRATDTRLKSIATGALTTALVQSSSVISLLVLAFSGAGFMGTGSAIAVIMGTNLGSTLNSWIVAFLGFKFSIEAFAMPFIAIGGLCLFAKRRAVRIYLAGMVSMGLGLLFLGLDFMKDAVDALAESIDLADVPEYSMLVLVIAGIGFTALVQASSATIAVVLAAVNSGLLDFQEAAAVVIGSNIGTTVTVLIGALGGTPAKKRVAVSHLLFNAVTAVIALSLLSALTGLIQTVPFFKVNSLYGIAAFHTAFNLLGILLFYPFIHWLAVALSRKISETEATPLRFLDRSALGTAETALASIAREVLHLLRESLLFNARVLGLPTPSLFLTRDEFGPHSPARYSPDQLYEYLKVLGGEIFRYGAALQKNPLNKEDAARLETLLRAARRTLNGSKYIKDISRNLTALKDSDDRVFTDAYRSLQLIVQTCAVQLLDMLPPKMPLELKETERLRARITEADRNFIAAILSGSEGAAHSPKVLTDALMANRYVCHACRMQLNCASSLLKSHAWSELPGV